MKLYAITERDVEELRRLAKIFWEEHQVNTSASLRAIADSAKEISGVEERDNSADLIRRADRATEERETSVSMEY